MANIRMQLVYNEGSPQEKSLLTLVCTKAELTIMKDESKATHVGIGILLEDLADGEQEIFLRDVLPPLPQRVHPWTASASL